MDGKHVPAKLEPVASELQMINILAEKGDEISVTIKQELEGDGCTPGTLADWRTAHLRTRLSDK